MKELSEKQIQLAFEVANIGVDVASLALVALLTAVSFEVMEYAYGIEGGYVLNMTGRLVLPAFVLFKFNTCGFRYTMPFFLIVCAFAWLLIMGEVGGQKQNICSPILSLFLTVLFFLILVNMRWMKVQTRPYLA